MKVNRFLASFSALAAFGFLSPTVLARPAEPIPLVAQAQQSPLSVIGPLQLGMSQDDAKQVLGHPESESGGLLIEATNVFSKQWFYPKQGVTLNLSSEKTEGPFTVESITIDAPSAYTAADGIVVGMLRTEAWNRFNALLTEDINTYEGGDEDKFGVMSVSSYTILAVNCSDGVVQQIYLGPGPE